MLLGSDALQGRVKHEELHTHFKRPPQLFKNRPVFLSDPVPGVLHLTAEALIFKSSKKIVCFWKAAIWESTPLSAIFFSKSTTQSFGCFPAA